MSSAAALDTACRVANLAGGFGCPSFYSPTSGQSAPGGSRLRLRADLQPHTTAAPLTECATFTDTGAAA